MLLDKLQTPTTPPLDPPQQFVGVCGIRGEADYQRLTFHAPTILEGTDAFIMAGIKDPTVRIGRACLSPLVKPFVHSDYTPGEDYVAATSKIVEQTHEYIQGLQLNVLPWVDTSYRPALTTLKRRYPDLKLILQAHRQTMEQHTPEVIAQELATLPVDYIMFDPSQSKGEPYDIKTMVTFAAKARELAPWIGVVVAGGLGNRYSPMRQYTPVAWKLPSISCDAFGQLQHPGRQYIDWLAVDMYLYAWRFATHIINATT